MVLGSLSFVPHPRTLREPDPAGTAVAVIDLLRASTTITAALAGGAEAIVPCATLASARARAARARTRGGPVVLAGERGGLRVPGFDLGNSPREMKGRVSGATVILATTNGTRALAAAARYGWAAVACLNNLTAAAAALAARPEPRKLVLAAGEGPGWSEEDALCAGLLLRALLHHTGGRPARDLDPPGRVVWARTAGVRADELAVRLLHLPHGRVLARLGFAQDVRDSARPDTTTVVGVLGPDGTVRPDEGPRKRGRKRPY